MLIIQSNKQRMMNYLNYEQNFNSRRRSAKIRRLFVLFAGKRLVLMSISNAIEVNILFIIRINERK